MKTRRRPLCIACLLALANAPAGYAQTSPPQPKAEATETIVVTGTHIQGIKPVGSQVITVDEETIARSGLTSIFDIGRTVPQIQTVGTLREGNNSGVNSTGGTAFNLRGLGRTATLLLIDGRRLTTNATNSTYIEATQVPLAAIERVEVIPDGASAIYGSDAVAGVVNYVLRRKFDGVQVGERYSHNRFFDESTPYILAGTSWAKLGGLREGSIVVNAERTRRDPMVQGDSPYLRQDLRQFGGRDLRFSGSAATASGVVPNIVVPRSTPNPLSPFAGNLDYYGLPVGTTGVGLTPGQLRFNDPNILDTSYYADYLGRLDRDLASVVLNQNIRPGLSAYVEAWYTMRTTLHRNISTQSLTLPSATVAGPYTATVGTPIPWYISGIPGVAAGTPLRVFYDTFKDIGYSYVRNQSETYTISSGLKFDLGRDWKGETYFTYGSDKTCGLCTFGISTPALQALVNAGRINPLSSQPVSEADAQLFTSVRKQTAHNQLRDFVVKGSGPLFNLPGGTLRSAAGYEHQENVMSLENWQNLAANTSAFPAPQFDPARNPYVNSGPFTSLTRRIDSGFGELYIPVVGDAQKMPMAKAINVNAAVRYDRYSDFGGTTNPKIGATWEVNNQFSFRSSWGSSYRAPGLAEVNPRVTSVVNLNTGAQSTVANNAGDPAIPRDANGNTTVVGLAGANANLIPEKAKVWSFGLELKPAAIKGLGLSATYYDIKFRDQIVFINAGAILASPTNRQLYSQFITVTPVPANCDVNNPATWNPQVRDTLNGVNLTGIVNTQLVCQARAIIDVRAQNAASTHQTGIDFAANQRWNTGVGDFTFNGIVSRVLKNTITPVQGGPQVDGLDRINSATDNFPVSWKGRLDLDWFKGMYSAGLSMNHIGSYLNDRPITILGVTQPTSTVPAWTTLDLRFGLDLDDSGWKWARGIRVNFAILNATDKNPPIVLSTVGAGGFDSAAIDANNHDPFGRRFSVNISKTF